jgi:uncharacterized protein with von Willebrand factor type A (vWA) domain
LQVNLIAFIRTLRRHGMTVSTRQVLGLFRALALTDMADQSDVFNASQCTLLTRPQDRVLFRQLFEAFWLKRSLRTTTNLRQPYAQSQGWHAADPAAVLQVQDGGTPGEPGDGGPERGLYSWVELLRQKDFADLNENELIQVRRLLAALPLELDRRRTRRLQSGRGHRLDFRATLRDSFRHDGEWLRWRRQRRQTQPQPLVVLADISGSMERYSRLLLQFVYAAVRRHQPGAEAFVFGTRLTRITRFLRERDVNSALDRVSTRVPDWSGGTRIGESLHTFNTTWARRMLGRQAVILLISDGWDRGDPVLLAGEVARLQRSAGSLIWLNPLLGVEDYRPLTRGLQAALPYVDAFMPANNLASLDQLAQVLFRPMHREFRMALRAPAAIRSRGGLAR